MAFNRKPVPKSQMTAPQDGGTRCPSCGGTNFIDQPGSGDRACAECGTVVQENNIVSTVQFSESGGSSNVVGQFVSGDRGRPSGGGAARGRGRFGQSRDSRDATIQNGKKKIIQVLAQLHLRTTLADEAARLFALCVTQNYVQGRKTMNIVAACVYIVCRQNHFPIMLIDISDKLAVNVYVLGKTFQKLIKHLNLQTQVPIVDPAMYIKRFAAKLDLGSKTNAVCMTALKIIGSMKRDFLASGRQPAGICCAALTLATRVNRIERSKEEIRKAVKVCDATVRKRLLEFEATPTSQLTVEELNKLPQTVAFPGVEDASAAAGATGGSGGGGAGGGESALARGGSGRAGAGATAEKSVPVSDIRMDPPAFIANRIRDGALKMPWTEQTVTETAGTKAGAGKGASGGTGKKTGRATADAGASAGARGVRPGVKRKRSPKDKAPRSKKKSPPKRRRAAAKGGDASSDEGSGEEEVGVVGRRRTLPKRKAAANAAANKVWVENDEEGDGDDGSGADGGGGDDDDDPEYSSGKEDEEDEEEEKEGMELGHYHELCKKPDRDPLEEPRFGVCFWSDAVPAEILEAWAASLQQEQQQQAGGSTARSSLLSSSAGTAGAGKHSGTVAAAAPSNGTTDGMTMMKTAAGGPQKQRQDVPKGSGSDSSEPPLPTLALPKPNRFIPSELGIKEIPAASEDGSSNNASSTEAEAGGKGGVHHRQQARRHSPRKVARKSPSARDAGGGGGGVERWTLWHLQDRTFGQPRAEIYLKVVTPVANESARSAALCELVVRLVNDSLTEYSYDAYVAELSYHVKATDAGFQIHVYGFDHKAPLMLREVLKRLLDLGSHLEEGPLSVQLEALIRGYHNTNMKPGRHVSNVRLEALRKGNWSPVQKQAALTGAGEGQDASGASGPAAGEGERAAGAGAALALSVAHVQAFLKRLFHRVEMEGLVHGNFSEADAKRVLGDIEQVAEEAAVSRRGGGNVDVEMEKGGGGGAEEVAFKYPEEPVVKLDPSQHVLYCCPSKDPTEQNCALEVYWQIGANNLEDRVIADAIEQVMDEPLYDQLRTKEQLGYSVGCSTRVTCGVLGFCITVQSAAYAPAHLYARVRAFMKSFRDTLAGMTEDTFSMNMESAAANKLQPDNTLSEEAQRYWPEIYRRRREFHVNVAEAAEMKGLEKSAVLRAYEEWFSGEGEGKPCLTLTVTGGGKFSADDEAKAIHAHIQEEIESSSSSKDVGGGLSSPSRKTCVRIATPTELYCPAEGRDVFPNLLAC